MVRGRGNMGEMNEGQNVSDLSLYTCIKFSEFSFVI